MSCGLNQIFTYLFYHCKTRTLFILHDKIMSYSVHFDLVFTTNVTDCFVNLILIFSVLYVSTSCMGFASQQLYACPNADSAQIFIFVFCVCLEFEMKRKSSSLNFWYNLFHNFVHINMQLDNGVHSHHDVVCWVEISILEQI